MATLTGFGEGESRRIASAVRWVEGQPRAAPLRPRPQRAAVRPDLVQLIRVTSGTPTSGLYPALVEVSGATGTVTDLSGSDCWAFDPTGAGLVAGYYFGRAISLNTDGRPVYAVDLPPDATLTSRGLVNADLLTQQVFGGQKVINSGASPQLALRSSADATPYPETNFQSGDGVLTMELVAATGEDAAILYVRNQVTDSWCFTVQDPATGLDIQASLAVGGPGPLYYKGLWATEAGQEFSGGLLTGGAFAPTWSDLGGTPTTLAGYGIASPLDPAEGGTGIGSTPSVGDLLVGDGTDYAILSVGTDGDVLTADHTQTLGVKWAAGGGMAIGAALSGGTAGRVLFEGSGPVLADSAAFLWNDLTQTLFVRTTIGNNSVVGADSTNAQQGILGSDNYAVGGFAGSYVGYLGTTGMLGSAAGNFQDAVRSVKICNGTDAIDVQGGPLHLEHHLTSTQPASPTVAANAAAGTGASASIVGTDTAGQITLSTGTIGIGAGSLLTVTFAVGFVNGTTVLTLAGNANAAAAATLIYATDGATTFDINATAGLTVNQTYTWNYHVIGN